MGVLAFLFLVVIVGFFLWLLNRSGRHKELAHDLAAGLNDTFRYLYRKVVSEERAEKLLAKGLTPGRVIGRVVKDVENKAYEDPGILLLGTRSGNARRGIELRDRAAEWENSIETAREYKRFEKEWPKLKKRLQMWKELHDTDFPVVLTQKIRDRHTYVIGKSGSGKTTLLTWMLSIDICRGDGAAFLTPEAETIEQDILPYIPEDRIKDVIYVNPADERSRYAFNPFYLDPEEDIDRKVEEVFSSLTRLMEGAGSARIHQILRQVIYALVEMPGASLVDVPRLLDRENPHYRKQVIAQINDEQTGRFWKDVYPQFPKNAHVPILTRLAPFIRQKRVRNVLCRPGKGLDFREIMDSGKILICNLSDGLLGEQTSRLLGGLIMSELQLAAVSRVDTPPKKRRRFYVYLDEFQSFTSHANVSYEKLLSRARKYRLPLILAHQQTGQLPTPLVQEIFGNVSTLISFLVSRRDANRIGRECVRDDQVDRQTIAPEELVTQEVGEAFVKIGTRAFPFYVSYTLQNEEPNPAVRAAIKAVSRRREETFETQAQGNGDSAAEKRANGVAEKVSENGEVPPDPFADLDDPQDLYGS